MINASSAIRVSGLDSIYGGLQNTQIGGAGGKSPDRRRESSPLTREIQASMRQSGSRESNFDGKQVNFSLGDGTEILVSPTQASGSVSPDTKKVSPTRNFKLQAKLSYER